MSEATADAIYGVLLALHVLAGFSSLFSSFVAMASKLAQVPHKVHQQSGRVFFWGMVVVFATALPMSVLRPNQFLFLVAIFSFYLAFAGWRLARNRKGVPEAVDWAAVAVMATTAVIMITWGVVGLVRGAGDAPVVLVVFGGLGGALSMSHLRALRAELQGTERIAMHVSMMMGATIATFTAFVVVNATFLPVLLQWLGPTFLLTPVTVLAQRRLRRGASVSVSASASTSTGAWLCLLLPAALLVPADAHAQETIDAQIRVQGAAEPERVRCAGFREGDGFPKAEASSEGAVAEAERNVAVCRFQFTPGKWAFAIFEDENLN